MLELLPLDLEKNMSQIFRIKVDTEQLFLACPERAENRHFQVNLLSIYPDREDNVFPMILHQRMMQR